MLSILFFLLTALGFILAFIYLFFGGKLLFKSASPLNGAESIIIALLLFLAIFVSIIGGIQADQSHHFLEYQNIVNEKAANNFNTSNYYDYYPLAQVFMRIIGPIIVLWGSFYYSNRKQEKHYASHASKANSQSHREWEESLRNILSKKRDHR